MILPPQKLITPFILKFHPKSGKLHFRTVLTLHTNASEFHIELVIYNGQLKVSILHYISFTITVILFGSPGTEFMLPRPTYSIS